MFGDRFRYTGCLQHTRHGPTQLRYLKKGSVILCGSCRRRTNFGLDTVFVVAADVDHRKPDCEQQLPGIVPDVHDAVTLRPWYINLINDQLSQRLYLGATVDDRVAGMFSFFPCLPASAAPRGFARPEIRIPGVITPTMTKNKRLNPLDTVAEVG